jgi:hypothetical protein
VSSGVSCKCPAAFLCETPRRDHSVLSYLQPTMRVISPEFCAARSGSRQSDGGVPGSGALRTGYETAQAAWMRTIQFFHGTSVCQHAAIQASSSASSSSLPSGASGKRQTLAFVQNASNLMCCLRRNFHLLPHLCRLRLRYATRCVRQCCTVDSRYNVEPANG